MQALSTTIRTWRKRASLSQAKLGEVLGITQAAVSKWERGEEVPPFWWPKLSEALSLSKTETGLLRQLLLDQYQPEEAPPFPSPDAPQGQECAA